MDEDCSKRFIAAHRDVLQHLTRIGRDYPAFLYGKIPDNPFAPLGRKPENLGHGVEFIHDDGT
jgi:hypothetical protein